MSRLNALADRWRAFAAQLRTVAAEAQAVTLEQAAAQLEAELAAEGDELLTLDAAALASGYSAESLRKLVATGQIPNAGAKRRPRIRRADLPKRPGQRTSGAAAAEQGSAADAYDVDVDALSLIDHVRRRAG